MTDIFTALDEKYQNTQKLDQLLTDVIKARDAWADIKEKQSEAWKVVEVAEENLMNEMNANAIKSFRGRTTGATAIKTEKTAADFSDGDKQDVMEFLANNDGEGVIIPTIRKDTLGKWLTAFLETGGKLPTFLALKKNAILQIRR